MVNLGYEKHTQSLHMYRQKSLYVKFTLKFSFEFHVKFIEMLLSRELNCWTKKNDMVFSVVHVTGRE